MIYQFCLMLYQSCHGIPGSSRLSLSVGQCGAPSKHPSRAQVHIQNATLAGGVAVGSAGAPFITIPSKGPH